MLLKNMPIEHKYSGRLRCAISIQTLPLRDLQPQKRLTRMPEHRSHNRNMIERFIRELDLRGEVLRVNRGELRGELYILRMNIPEGNFGSRMTHQTKGNYYAWKASTWDTNHSQ